MLKRMQRLIGFQIVNLFRVICALVWKNFLMNFLILLFVTRPALECIPKTGIDIILKIAPHKIIYVSCNPTTLARDVTILNEKYKLREVQPLDMFPHTYHIESVCRLEKK